MLSGSVNALQSKAILSPGLAIKGSLIASGPNTDIYCASLSSSLASFLPAYTSPFLKPIFKTFPLVSSKPLSNDSLLGS